MAIWAAFVAGLVTAIAATPHCLGMCGGFPLHLSKPESQGAFIRQICFVVGKTFTYMFLGSIASAIGVISLRNTPLSNGAPILGLLAGVLTVAFGLRMLGCWLPGFKSVHDIADTGFMRSIFGALLDRPSPATALTLGIGVGFLPCPLPMAMLALAAASRDVIQGLVLMAGVGLGTAPGLLAIGLLGAGIRQRFTRYGTRLAAVVVLAIGVLTIARASGIISRPDHSSRTTPSCCGKVTK